MQRPIHLLCVRNVERILSGLLAASFLTCHGSVSTVLSAAAAAASKPAVSEAKQRAILFPQKIAPVDSPLSGIDEFRIPLTNHGSLEMTVAEVKSDCECVKVRSFPEDLAPGASGDIILETRPVRPGEATPQLTLKAVDDSGHEFSESASLVVRVAKGEFPSVLTEYLLPVSEVPIKIAEPWLLVDVRAKGTQETSGIAGAVDSELFMLRSRIHLKERTVVLIGSGWDDARLASEAAELHEAGWKSVRVLHGGIRAWSRAGRPLTGGKRLAAVLSRASIDDLLAAYRSNRIVLVTASAEERNKLPAVLNEVFDVSAVASVGKPPASAPVKSGGGGSAPRPRILVTAHAQLAAIEKKSRPQDLVFVLDGTWEQLSASLEARFKPAPSKEQREQDLATLRKFRQPHTTARVPCGKCP